MAGPSCFVLSGCSGGGKSTLIEALALGGHATVPEAGREIVRSELASGGRALPWEDSDAFLKRMVEKVRANYEGCQNETGPVFFDRGLVEVANHYELRRQALPPTLRRALEDVRFASPVFMVPPWEEIFERDAERRHDFDHAVAEYETLLPGYRRHGYDIVLLPKVSVEDRVEFVLGELSVV